MRYLVRGVAVLVLAAAATACCRDFGRHACQDLRPSSMLQSPAGAAMVRVDVPR